MSLMKKNSKQDRSTELKSQPIPEGMHLLEVDDLA